MTDGDWFDATGFGIDLGTTRTAIAMVAPKNPEKAWFGQPQVIRLPDGETTPSVVLFEKDTEVVGTSAKNMGHRATDCAQIFKRQMPDPDWTFEPVSRPGAGYSAEDLSAILLKHVARDAESVTGLTVHHVVITVPAYFGEVERRRTRDAGKRAGLQVLDIINEPTAAVLAYLFQPGVQPRLEAILVFDLGGGTFDTVVVVVDHDDLRVVAIKGDLLLGGRDFDETLAARLSNGFVEKHPGTVPPLADVDARPRLLGDVEAARERLSAAPAANVTVWGAGAAGNTAFSHEIQRSEMEGLLATQVGRCVSITESVLDEARQRGVVPTRVLFVGGASKTPMVRRAVLDAFPQLTELKEGAEPDLLVAKGAAVWAQKLLLDRTLVAVLGEGFSSSTKWQNLDWESDTAAHLLRGFADLTGLQASVVRRLLCLRMTTVSSRGYGILTQAHDTGELFLTYILAAQDDLPYRSEQPHRFAWTQDITDWHLEIFEDTEAARGTMDPNKAKRVEVIQAPLHELRPKGSKFEVTVAVDRDQIIHLTARHTDGDPAGDDLDVQVDTRREAPPRAVRPGSRYVRVRSEGDR